MLGHGEETEEVTPRVVEALLGRDVRQISCGTEHMLAVTCRYSIHDHLASLRSTF